MLQNNAHICHVTPPLLLENEKDALFGDDVNIKALVEFMDELSDVEELSDLEELMAVDLEETGPLSYQAFLMAVEPEEIEPLSYQAFRDIEELMVVEPKETGPLSYHVPTYQHSNDWVSESSSSSTPKQKERKSVTPWTREEHELFLLGLERLGKGKWAGISREVVITKTPSQVASHAQKFFLRQNPMKKVKRRSSSLLDVITVSEDVREMFMTFSEQQFGPRALLTTDTKSIGLLS